MQRHRFGRRAESLPEDQLLLGIEEAEQVEAAGRAAEERRAARQARSRPLVDALEPWLREKLALVSQKSKLAEAIRPVALYRKNALFAGSDGGAQHWAVIASLIETCKLTAVEPRHYLADVITRIVDGHLNSRLDDLLPWAYPTTAALKAVA